MNLTSACKCQHELAGLCLLTISILSVSFVVGIVVNGLVLWMTAFRMTRTVTTIWFFNLALADFTILLSLPVIIYSLVAGQWHRGSWACKFYQAFLGFTAFTSICLLVVISVDRCISVLYPIWARNHRTVQRASWLVVGVWLLAAVTCSPYLGPPAVGEREGCESCFFKFNTHYEEENRRDWTPEAFKWQTTVIIIYFLGGFLVPLVIIGICAFLIRTKLQGEGRVYASRPRRLLLVLVSTFFIFWFPFNMARFVQLGQRKPCGPTVVLTLWLTFSLGCLNSCLNPFLYVFFGRNFKEKFFQSLPSALARAFDEEGFLNHPVQGEVPRG